MSLHTLTASIALSIALATLLGGCSSNDEPAAPPAPPGPTNEPDIRQAEGAFCHGMPDGSLCDDENPCTTADVCGLGTCEGRLVEDGTDCEDGDLCTVGGQCKTGECVSSPMDCSQLDTQCSTGTCNGDKGECEPAPNEDGGLCDDNNICTLTDACLAGECVGVQKNCSVLDSDCTKGTCALDTGDCVAAPIREALTCDDANPCTSLEQCSAGTCKGVPKDCSSLDTQCRLGECNMTDGECSTVARVDNTPCDDTLNCTTPDVCLSGQCVGTPVDCSGLDSDCGGGRCDDASGACVVDPVQDGTQCNDDAPCTGHDVCDGGSCAGTAGLCTACAGLNANDPCDDGNPCTSDEVCVFDSGVLFCEGPVTVDCSGLDNACAVGVCQPATGTCLAVAQGTGMACDDGDACTLSDTCAAGSCKGESVDTCGMVVDACEADAPNDLLTEATTLVLGDTPVTLLQRTNPTGESDWYEVALIAEQRLSVSTSAHCGVTMDTLVVVTDSEGDILATDDDSGAGPFSGLVDFVVPEDGTYYVNVGTYVHSGVGTYFMTASAVTPPPCVDDASCGCGDLTCTLGGPDAGKCVAKAALEVEPNDDFGLATSMPAGLDSEIQGVFSPAFDVDWYSVVLPGGAPFAIGTRAFCGGGVDPDLTVFAADGTTVVAFDADSGPNGQARVVLTPAVDGTYLIRTRGELGSTGKYVLGVEDLRCLVEADCTCADAMCPSDGTTPLACAPSLSEPEPGAGPVPDLALGARTHSVIDDPLDIDTFAISLTPGTYIAKSESYCGSQLDTVVTIRNALNEIVGQNDDNGQSFFSTAAFVVNSAGDYTVEVRANGGATGEYIVEVAAAP